MSAPLPRPAGDADAAERVLLACARPALTPEDEARLADALARGPAWDRVMALGARNRLLPLLHRHLSTRDGVPGDVADALRRFAAANARDALVLAGELRRLLDAMAAEGIRAVAYKGPALAVRAYGGVALRTYSDLDLLVAPEDAPGASRVLAARGYVAHHDFSPAQDALFRRIDGDYPWHHPASGVMVEVHTRVSSHRFVADLPTDAILRRAVPAPLGGGQVRVPADEDAFLALCVHGAKHRWARLEWLATLAALAASSRIDLAAMRDRAAAAGARRTVLLALHLASTALHHPVPSSIDDDAQADAEIRALAEEARALWFAAEAEDESTAANLRFNYRLRDGAADRARYAARWLFTPSPEDWAWARLPAPLSPLHRALRPLRLALRYGPRRRR